MTLYKKQRGALFGLDARIALAIIGSLSVVTGVAMVQTSTSARASALEKELANIAEIVNKTQEIWGKSTFDLLAASYKSPTVTEEVEAKNAVYAYMDDSVLNPRPAQWVGPYFSNFKTESLSATSKEVRSLNYGAISLFKRKNDAETTDLSQPLVPNNCDSSNKRNCYLWLMLEDVPTSLAKYLDETMDDSNNRTGALRYWKNTSSGRMFYQGPRTLP